MPTGNIGGNISISKNITIAVQNTSDYGDFTLTRDGAYTITVNSGYTLTIKNIIIDGNNISSTKSLFWVVGTMNMEGQSKTDETIPDYNNCKIINSLKTNSLPTNGAAVHVYRGRLVCNGVTFENNENRDIHTQTEGLTYGGGALAFHDGASFSLTNCHFYNNKAYESGGAILLEYAGNSSIRNCTFGDSGKPNTAYLGGGAIYGLMQNGKALDIEGNTTFQYNQVVYNETTGIINPLRMGLGGAACLITFSTTSSTFNIGTESSSKIVFNNNYARFGGGALVLWCANPNARFKLCNFSMENNWTDCIGTDNESGGGALFVHGANSEGHSDDHFIIQNGVIRNNHSINYGGAMLIDMHDCKVENVTFESNYTTVASNGRGGGVMIFGNESSYTHTNQFINCNFYKNGINGSTTTTEFGGAIYSVNKTNIHLIGCTVGGSPANANKATGHGGGVFIGPNSYLTIDPYNSNRGIVSYNEAVNGGGIYVANGSQGHTDIGSSSSSLPVHIKYNTATGTGGTGGMGGGIYLECGGHINDRFTLKNFELTDNTASRIGMGGGAYLKSAIVSGEVHNHTAMTISNGTVSGNTAYHGGGIYFDHHDADITNVTFDSHTVSGNGGGVFINGHSNDNGDPHEHDFTSCTFTANSAMNGGAVYVCNQAKASFESTNIGTSTKPNTATNNGGGVYMLNSCEVVLNNANVQYNTAGNFGSGVYLYTKAILGVKGAVRVYDNKSTRSSNTNYSYSDGYRDDVCLHELHRENNGKIKVMDDLAGSKIGITEQQVASGQHRSHDLAGDMIRQFTIDYGDFGSPDSKAFNKDVFESNDNELPVKLLLAVASTTSKLEVTLGSSTVGNKWYVAGITDDNNQQWGFDDNTPFRGLFPDLPRRTLTGPNGVFAQEGFDPENDHIFVVRSLSAYEEAETRTTDGKAIIRYPNSAFDFTSSIPIPDTEGSKEVSIYRYPGGHLLSNLLTDEGGASSAGAVASGSHAGPGINKGPVFSMDDNTRQAVLRNIHMDGLREYSKEGSITTAIIDELDPNHIFNPSYVTISPNSALLSVDPWTTNTTITLKEHCEIEWNDNKYDNETYAFYGKERRPGGGVYCAGNLIAEDLFVADNNCATNGGGIYIASGGTVSLKDSTIGGDEGDKNTANNKGGGVYKLGTLKVKGNTTVTENTSGTAKAVIRNNVYIPTNSADENMILITGELACSSSIGVTKTKTDHTYDDDDNFTQVRTAIAKNEVNNSGHALTAFNRNVFFDDTDKYGVWCMNYQKGGNLSDSKAYSVENDYFIETWRSFAATSFASANQIKTPEEFALFAKQVNTGNDYSGKNVIQVADIDLALHYWEPIGFEKNSSNCAKILLPFLGSYDGQGHLIRNAFSILPAEDMGVFGTVGTIDGPPSLSTIQRTFVINHDFVGTNEITRGLGGLVGSFDGQFINRCEAAGKLSHYKTGSTKNRTGSLGTGGLVGVYVSGTIINSFTVSEISNVINPTGGILGSGLSAGIVNCYTKNTIHNDENITIGAILGQIDISGNIQNCYVVSSNIDVLAGDVSAESKMMCCYAPYDRTKPMYATTSDKQNGKEIGTNDNAKNAYYSPTIGADQLGYMYADNILVDNNGDATSINTDIFQLTVTVTGPLFESLNSVANIYNSMSFPPGTPKIDLDLWARPALAYYVEDGSKAVSIERPINGDLPVLMMDNYGDGTDGKVGRGGFTALSTVCIPPVPDIEPLTPAPATIIGEGYVLQYSGPKRDYSEYDNYPSNDNSEIDGMIKRSNDNNGPILSDISPDCHFIYGDVSKAPSLDISANRISIYEHAAITKAGKLGSFDNTHVSITFDNSGTHSAVSTEGMNQLGALDLPRDWHLLSTPLLDASTGFNYKGQNSNTYVSGQDYSASGYFNNPWAGGDASNPGGNEFGWLGGGNNRYWMTGWTGSQNVTLNAYPSLADWTDGYFPSAVESTVTNFSLNQGCIPTADENGRYPYGMDFYSWTEPNYHYINFKRNGPNHWHSDPNANGEHDHLAYKPEIASNYASPHENVNEEILLAGKGYFASIAEKTLLQSSGQLGTNTNKTIGVTCSTYPNTVPFETGWNLVGNPFHAYLDFDQLCTDNSGKITEDRYLVYNADGFGSTNNDGNSGNYGNGFSYYVKNGSAGGAYAHRYLHPHQGFFVKVSSGPTLNFAESQTVLRSQIGTSGSYRDDSRPAYPLVNLFLTSDKGCSDVCVVEFNRPEWGGATKLRDMYSGNGLFYATHDDGNYAALFATPEAERIPLKFEAKDEAGDTYTIHWNTQNGDFHKLYLVDNITGVQYDMLRNSSYSFSGKKDDYWTRFYITFEVTGLDEEQDDEDDDASTGSASTTFAFFDGSQWVVTNDGHGTATLDFIDLQGRVLHSTTLAEGQARIGLPDVAKGMYLMRMTNQNGMFVQKIVVK